VNLCYGEFISPLVFLHDASTVPTYCLSYSVDSDARYSVRVVAKKRLASKASSRYDCVSHVVPLYIGISSFGRICLNSILASSLSVFICSRDMVLLPVSLDISFA